MFYDYGHLKSLHVSGCGPSVIWNVGALHRFPPPPQFVPHSVPAYLNHYRGPKLDRVTFLVIGAVYKISHLLTYLKLNVQSAKFVQHITN